MVATLAQPDAPREQSIVLDRMSWSFYEQLLAEVDDRHLFITYNKGRMELMSPSWKHESYSEQIGQLVRILARHFKLPYLPGGSTTFRLKDRECGLEPDKCFYIQNVRAVLGKDQVDLGVDPPPDLAIEIEISRRLLDRIEIYHALGLPEVWTYDGKRLKVLARRARGYEEVQQSLVFPLLPISRIPQLLEMAKDQDASAWEDAVCAWLLQNANAR
jgi:Uma2 family endonuclease